jgi:hypothetical protein
MTTLNEVLRKNYPTRSKQQQVLSILESAGDPGKIAWKHIELNQKVHSDSLMERFSFYNEFLVQPLGTIVFWFIFLFAPGILTWLGIQTIFSGHRALFSIFTAGQTFWKGFQNLVAWEDYWEAQYRFRLWHAVTHSNKGPYITGPLKYYPLVYADAIARITQTLRSMLLQRSS